MRRTIAKTFLRDPNNQEAGSWRLKIIKAIKNDKNADMHGLKKPYVVI